MSKNIYTPTTKPEDWQPLLAKPIEHWKDNHSAKAMAFCWEEANGFPLEVKRVLNTIDLDLNIILAIPEYEVSLDTIEYPSHNDLFVLAEGNNGLYVIMVEGKVAEEFGPLVSKWYSDTPSRKSRINYLLDKMEIGTGVDSVNDLRYQLFHRTTSAINMAEKFNAIGAIMLVHSFSQSHDSFSDYAAFISFFTIKRVKAKLGEMYNIKKLKSGIELYAGWVTGDKKYLYPEN